MVTHRPVESFNPDQTPSSLADTLGPDSQGPDTLGHAPPRKHLSSTSQSEAHRRERLLLLLRQCDVGIIAMAVAAITAGLLLGLGVAEPGWIVPWAGLALALDCTRLGVVLIWRRRLTRTAPGWLEPAFVATAWTSGGLWVLFGLAAPVSLDPALGSLTLLLPIAIAAIAVTSYGASPWAALGTVVILICGMLLFPPPATAALGPLGPGLLAAIGFILLTGGLRQGRTIAQVVSLDLAHRQGIARVQTLRRSLEARTVSQQAAERELSRTGTLLHTLADAAPVGLFRATPSGRLDYMNALGRQMLGLEPDGALPDDPWIKLLHPLDQPSLEQAWNAGEMTEKQARVQLRTGTWWLLLRWAPMVASDGTVLGVAGTVTDITEVKLREESLTVQATTDGLTGLMNRSHFLAVAQREVDRALRYSRPLAVVALDLDHFKQVNDTFGHSGGDAVLKEFAGRARSVLRSTDLMGRTGGEEFTLCLAECGLEGAVILAERLRRTMAETVFAVEENRSTHVTISLGVAVLHDEREGLPELIKRADAALYRAKAQGRNRLCVADPPLRTLGQPLPKGLDKKR